MNLGYPYIERAWQLQRGVRRDEREQREDFPDEELRQAVMYTRQDVVLLVSLLASLNGQMRVVRWLLFALLGAVLFALFR